MTDILNVNVAKEVNENGLIAWEEILAGQPSKFQQINMVGSIYDRFGNEILGGSSGGMLIMLI